MTISESCPPKKRKVLIITSSGGGGLLQAANAKEQELRAKDPHVVIIRRDVMKDWMRMKLGKVFISLWNRAQLQGNVWVQSFFAAIAPFVEIFFRPPIFFFSLYTLFKEDIDQVIDTQVMGTSAILKALRFFNRRKKKQVHLEKVLVDLPTKKATHFFVPIRSLSEKDRKWFRLITVAPLLEEGQTEEEFWKQNCNLTFQNIQYEDYYVRQSFLRYRHLARKAETALLRTRYQSREELSSIEKSVSRGAVQFTVKDRELLFSISPESRVFTLLLGSQPANHATLNYVKKFIELSEELQENQYPVYLFVFCSYYTPDPSSLFQKVTDYVHQHRHNSLLTIVPMSFQDDDVIAPLFFRSDMTCTRSGGQTAMELLSVSQGEIWIHSEAKKTADPITNDELLKGIPGWESANASYLQHRRNAKIVTPDTFVPLARKLMSKKVS